MVPRLLPFVVCFCSIVLLLNAWIYSPTPAPCHTVKAWPSIWRVREGSAASSPARVQDHAQAEEAALPHTLGPAFEEQGGEDLHRGSSGAKGCPLPTDDSVHANTGGERYLAFQPQGGLSNQLLGLAHAVAWAVVLDRRLVLPHLLPHQDMAASGGEANSSLTAYEGQPPSLQLAELLPFESLFAPRAVAGLRTISMPQLLRLGVRPTAVVQLPEIEATRYMKSSAAYFDALGWGGVRRQPVELQQDVQGCNAFGSCKQLLPPLLVRRTFGGCTQQVLAFESLFSTIRVQSNWTYCFAKGMPTILKPEGVASSAATASTWRERVRAHTSSRGPLTHTTRKRLMVRGRRLQSGGGLRCLPLHTFLESVALPSLLKPQPSLKAAATRAVHGIVQRMPAARGGLGCVQVRRGDFAAYCLLVQMRARAEGEPLAASCAPAAADIAQELAAAEAQAGQPIAWFAATNDAGWLNAQPELRPFQLRTLADVGLEGTDTGLEALTEPTSWKQLLEATAAAQELRAVLLDQMVCSRARHLLLNQFSSFKATLAIHAGVESLGRVLQPRSLEAHLGVRLSYLGAAAAAAAQNASALCAAVMGGNSTLRVRLVVLGWRRLASLRRLIRSLQLTLTCGTPVPLRLLLDNDAAPSVVAFASQFTWEHGPLMRPKPPDQTVSGAARGGLRAMWLQAFTPLPGEEDHDVVVLEDDLELSPYWLVWLHRAAAAFGLPGSDASQRQRGVVGISLYTPRLDEISAVPPMRQRSWRASQHVAAPAYLMQLPSSWGALFFHSALRRFEAFYAQRTAPPLYSFAREAEGGQAARRAGEPLLALPNSRSNGWPRSWKRFFLDWMVSEGLVMLYPSLPDEASFSTTHVEPGEHTAPRASAPIQEQREYGLRSDGGDPTKTVPLVKSIGQLQPLLSPDALPPYRALAVVDLHARASSLCQLAIQATRYADEVRALARARVVAAADGGSSEREQELEEAVLRLQETVSAPPAERCGRSEYTQ